MRTNLQSSKSDGLLDRKGTAMTTITLSRTASDTSKASGIVTGLVASFCGILRGRARRPGDRSPLSQLFPDVRPRPRRARHDPLRHLSRRPGGPPRLTDLTDLSIPSSCSTPPVRGLPRPDGLIFLPSPDAVLRYRSARSHPRRRAWPRLLLRIRTANLFSVFPEHLSAQLFAHAKRDQARRRRGAVPGRRSGRRLLPDRAGPAQGQHHRTVGRRAHSRHSRSGRDRRRAVDHRRPAALGFGLRGARFRAQLHQPHRVRRLRQGSIRRSTSTW